MTTHDDPRTSITALLSGDNVNSDVPALDQLIPHIYEELREMAHRQLAGEYGARTLQTTALIHEAYVRLVDDTQVSKKGRSYFFASAARAMRRVLVDQARKRKAGKRGGGQELLSIDDAEIAIDQFAGDLVDLDEALRDLASMNPRQAQVIECRFFGGLGVKETADALNVSERTVRNDWTLARAWLHNRLKTA